MQYVLHLMKPPPHQFTCAPVVESSGLLSSRILRKRGKRREIPLSGSTCHRGSIRTVTQALSLITAQIAETQVAARISPRRQTDQSHGSLVDGRQGQVRTLDLPHLHRIQPQVGLCRLVDAVVRPGLGENVFLDGGGRGGGEYCAVPLNNPSYMRGDFISIP